MANRLSGAERKARAEVKLKKMGVDVRKKRKRKEVKQKDGSVKKQIVFDHYELRLRGFRKVFRTQDDPSISIAWGSRKEWEKFHCPAIYLRRPDWLTFYYDEKTKTWAFEPPWRKE